MKKAMLIMQVAMYLVMAILMCIYTIGSLVQAGWQGYHFGFVGLTILFAILVKIAVTELVTEYKK